MKSLTNPSHFMGMYIRIFICLFILGFSLFINIFQQNELTELRMIIPSLAKEVRTIQEENMRLQYAIDNFESPIHLMELLRMPEFGRLKYPYIKDVIILPQQQPIPGKNFSDFYSRAPND